MQKIFFEIDIIAFFIALGFIFIALMLWQLSKRYDQPTFLFSDINGIKNVQKSWRIKLSKIPLWLAYAALGCFLFAFLDPRFQLEKVSPFSNQQPTEGIAIYILADQSGSMATKIPISQNHKNEMIRKMDLLKEITIKFVQGDSKAGLKGRKNDLIGLVAFARNAHILSPLTLDHQEIINKLSKLNVVENKEEDGTSMGYAVLKTVNLLAATNHYANNLIGDDIPAYEIKSSIIILITDGFPAPNPLDEHNALKNTNLLTAAEFAKEKGIRIYLITINPSLMTEEFKPHRNLMNQVAQMTGGKYYFLQQGMSLNQIYTDIDTLEKSILPDTASLSKDRQPNRFMRISLYPYFILCGLIAWLLSIILETNFLKRAP